MKKRIRRDEIRRDEIRRDESPRDEHLRWQMISSFTLRSGSGLTKEFAEINRRDEHLRWQMISSFTLRSGSGHSARCATSDATTPSAMVFVTSAKDVDSASAAASFAEYASTAGGFTWGDRGEMCPR